MFYSRILSYTLLSVFILAAVACAPSASKTDAPSAAPGDSGAPGRDRQSPAGGTTRESNLPSASDQPKEGKATAKSSLDELQAGKSTATPRSSPLRDVLFDYDRYELTADARDILKANADWLKGNGSVRVEVEGHCDERGTNEYNLALGAKRSQTVKDYLVRLGIAAERISTMSYGEEIPVCTEANENCWRQNRRARFIVTPSRPAT